jgi:hypothetical protein
MNINKYRLAEIHEQLVMYLNTNGFSKTIIHTYDSFLRNCYYCFLSSLKISCEDLLHKYLQLNPNCKKAKVISMLARIQYFHIHIENIIIINYIYLLTPKRDKHSLKL